jgi:hypothetical protein
VAGCCESGDEPSSSGATELAISLNQLLKGLLRGTYRETDRKLNSLLKHDIAQKITEFYIKCFSDCPNIPSKASSNRMIFK